MLSVCRLWVMVLVSAVVVVVGLGGCADEGGSGSNAEQVVVVYTALDRQFSEPIFRQFEKETGITVRAKYDTESTKTVGLVNAIRAERARPRCDVFWNNEIVNTLRLKQEGLLSSFDSAAAGAFPESVRDPDGYYVGFAARARVLLVNTNLVAEGDQPHRLSDLTLPRWKGQVGIAKPLFGTTATHAACLFALLGPERAERFFMDLLANDVRVLASNSQCALSVAAGRVALALTDTDDAMVQIRAGQPVRIVYPDAGEDEMGVVFIPNTLALIKGCPHPQTARKLIEYLLSPEVEKALALCPSAQIPLNPNVVVDLPIKRPGAVKPMAVDFVQAATQFETAASFIKEKFLR